MAVASMAATDDTSGGPLPLSRLKRQYSDFLSSKTAEIEERKEARRYRHGAHWTSKEIKVLNDRGQPVITYNRIQRKIDGVVGLIERLRQDPKAYPRTPKQEEGAELATSTLRYALEANDWRSLSPDVAHSGAVDGIGGLKIELIEGDQGDNDIGLQPIDPEEDGFFYDPRSVRADFSDARYMGLAKWMDEEAACEMFPDQAQAIRDNMGGDSGSDTTIWDDKEVRWTNVREKRIRVVEHWYKRQGEWSVCFYSGSLELGGGLSQFRDEKGRTICPLIMFSNAIDHDGDRYGFVRNLKGPQDEINQRRSKGLHLFNSRRIIAEEGAVQDVEITRREAARPDGMVIVNPGMRLEFDDAEKAASAAGNLAMLAEAKAELENFGPNPALIGQGQGVAGSSGRAIALLQQAGIAELGPYILRYRGWKLRVYRAVWNGVQQYWTGERFIRVTDDEDLAQFIQVNGLDTDPMTGQPVLVNALGNLDVDIILDEGPDQVNSMADAYDTLIALSQRGTPIPPDIILELSSLPASVKKKLLGKIEQAQQPDPVAQQAQMLELQGKQAETEATKARAAKDLASIPVQRAKAAKDNMATIHDAVELHLAASPFTGLVAPDEQEQAFMGPGGFGMPPSAPPGAIPPPPF